MREAITFRRAGLGACVALVAGVLAGCDGPRDGADAAVAEDSSADGAIEHDGDGDGVPAARDCDDTDAAVGTDATRACTSSCAAGTESCTEGAWTVCSASTDCACSEPGAMRTVDCGRCGIASQRCGADGTWELPSECFSEGECFAGEIERDTTLCGSRARICDASCAWLGWEVTTPPGECEAGTEERTTEGCEGGRTVLRRCSTECRWETEGACEVVCSRLPHASRSGADPVCIPAGPFVLGAEVTTRAIPVQVVSLSEFYVDRVPVTKARYEMCRRDGACPDPSDLALYDATADGDFATGLVWPSAVAFCAWDGGALINEYQWEKAARGAAPDTRLRPWGDAVGDCAHHPWTGCNLGVFPVDSFPASVSPFGVRLLGSLLEWTASVFTLSHDGVSDTDPTGMPVPDGGRVTLRGHDWIDNLGRVQSWETEVAVHRYYQTSTTTYVANENGFRCVY